VEGKKNCKFHSQAQMRYLSLILSVVTVFSEVLSQVWYLTPESTDGACSAAAWPELHMMREIIKPSPCLRCWLQHLHPFRILFHSVDLTTLFCKTWMEPCNFRQLDMFTTSKYTGELMCTCQKVKIRLSAAALHFPAMTPVAVQC
jgi:hypothetical protein